MKSNNLQILGGDPQKQNPKIPSMFTSKILKNMKPNISFWIPMLSMQTYVICNCIKMWNSALFCRKTQPWAFHYHKTLRSKVCRLGTRPCSSATQRYVSMPSIKAGLAYRVLVWPPYHVSIPNRYGTICPILLGSAWYGIPCYPGLSEGHIIHFISWSCLK